MSHTAPAEKRIETFTGVTNASGDYTVTYSPTYSGSVSPNVSPQMFPSNNVNMIIRITAATVTGFTVRVEQKSALNVLGIDVVTFNSTPVVGANVKVTVMEV